MGALVECASEVPGLADLEAMAARPLRLAFAPDAPDGLPHGVALVRVPTPNHARLLLAPACPGERERRSAVFHNPVAYRARSRLPIGQHDRMEEYLLARGRICAADKKGQDRHFPIHLKSIRLDMLKLEAGEVADLSSLSATDWPWLHFNEELYLRVSIGQLIVAPGSGLRWAGNVACVQIGDLVASSRTDADMPFTIAIRGTSHPAYSAVRPDRATNGAAGLPGVAGRDGAVSVVPTPFGPRPIGARPSAADGECGGDGGPGAPGGQGRSGGMAMLAGIEIGAIEGFAPGGLRLDVEAGRGEPGSAGGAGGKGGDGGQGAAGWAHPAGENTAGRGGAGGIGGRGGDGGKGGAGGLASHVFLTVPQTARGTIGLDARPARGGPPGAGGERGIGGRGGAGGRGICRPFSDPMPDGPSGPDGADGLPGRRGAIGRAGPAPPVWIHTASDD